MDATLSKAVLQIDVTPKATNVGEFLNLLASSVIDETLDTVGCHFTHGEVFKVQSADDGRTIIKLHSKSADGIENYKKTSSGILAALAGLGDNVSYTTSVLLGSKKVLPSNKPNFEYSSRPGTSNVEPNIFTHKRPIHGNEFQGALGLPSSKIESTTNRFTDFHEHKQKATHQNKDSSAISKAAKVEARFHDFEPHKRPPTVSTDAIGLSSKEKDLRDPANRFENEGVHFGQLNPLAGPGLVAGVTANNQPHEIDRFDSPRKHFGSINPLSGPGVTAGVTAANQPHEIDRFETAKPRYGQQVVNSGGDVAGVQAQHQPHEIDRFDAPRAHFGTIDPHAGPGRVAGVKAHQQPHEIDRFDNAMQHYGQINPLDGPEPIAGVIASKQPHEIDRFDAPLKHHAPAPVIGKDYGGTPSHKTPREEVDRFDKPAYRYPSTPVASNGVAGVPSNQEPGAKEIDRFERLGTASASKVQSPNGYVRQPPGGMSSFTFG